MRPYPITAFLICLLALSSCREEIIRPSPPAGSYVFGGKTNEVGTSILELSDGNFLLLGGVQDEKEYDYDISFTKVDPNGAEMWTKAIRDPDDDSYGLYLRKIAGGYVVLALRSDNLNYYNSSIVLHWFDDDLNETRKVVLGNPAGGYGRGDLALGMVEMDNGGFLIPTHSYGTVVVLRINADGSMEDPYERTDASYSFPTNFLTKKPNGGFILIANDTYGDPRSLNMVHLDATGQYVNTTTTSLDAYGYPEVKCVYAAADGTYYITFSEYETNPALIQVDSAGNVFQELSLGRQGNYNFMWPLSNGSFLLAGGDSPYTYSENSPDAYFGILDSTGTFTLSSTFGGDESDRIRGATLSSNGNLYLLGQTQSYGAGGTDMYLIITQP